MSIRNRVRLFIIPAVTLLHDFAQKFVSVIFACLTGEFVAVGGSDFGFGKFGNVAVAVNLYKVGSLDGSFDAFVETVVKHHLIYTFVTRDEVVVKVEKVVFVIFTGPTQRSLTGIRLDIGAKVVELFVSRRQTVV